MLILLNASADETNTCFCCMFVYVLCILLYIVVCMFVLREAPSDKTELPSHMYVFSLGLEARYFGLQRHLFTFNCFPACCWISGYSGTLKIGQHSCQKRVLEF